MQTYLLRLAEQAVVTFGSGFFAALAVANGSWTKAVLVGAVSAGVRAVYGMFSKPVGDGSQPSVL